MDRKRNWKKVDAELTNIKDIGENMCVYNAKQDAAYL